MASVIPTQQRMTNRRYKVAFAISFAFFVAYFDRTNVSVLIAHNEFTDDLGITGDKFKQGLLLTAFLFPYGFCNFVTGPLGDRIGGRRSVVFAVTSWTVLMCVMGASSSFGLMLAMRILLGLGESIMTPACNMIVAEWFPDRERARANSAWLGGLFLAPAISFPIIVWIVNALGWRASFFVLAAVGVLVALPMMWRWTTDRPEQHSAVSTGELEYIRSGQSRSAPAGRLRDNLRELLGNYRLWICSFSYMGYGLGFWGLTTFVPSYLEQTRDMSFTASGVLSVAPWLAAAVLNFIGGMVGDRRPKGRVLLWTGGYLLAAVLSLWGTRIGSTGLSIALIAMAVGFVGFTLAPMWSVIQEITPANLTGLGTGIANGVSYIASAFGPALVGAIVNSTGSYDLGFTILAGFLVITALALAPLWRSHLPRGRPSHPTNPGESGRQLEGDSAS